MVHIVHLVYNLCEFTVALLVKLSQSAKWPLASLLRANEFANWPLESLLAWKPKFLLHEMMCNGEQIAKGK